jgi:hypothetical protein
MFGNLSARDHVRDETENEEKYLWRHLMIYEYTLLLSVS